jgi:hypothetical protein
MSELTELHRSPRQTQLFDADDPRYVDWAPHSHHCRATEQRSHRFPGEPRRICINSCPRRAQIDKYVLGTITIDTRLLDESIAALAPADDPR